MIRVTALGHASVLIEAPGWRCVCDPVLGERLGPRLLGRQWLRKRRSPPVMGADALGRLDLVLLSHAHWDHTCPASLTAIAARSPHALAVVQRGNLDLVQPRFARHAALAWGETLELPVAGDTRVRVQATPVRHWGARLVIDRWRGFGGYLLEWPTIASPNDARRPLAILFAGDTAYTHHFRALRTARGGAGVDLAIMPIGAYDPWISNHCTPEQAWSMAIEDLGAASILPVHYDTFRLSREPVGEALQRLLAAAERAGARERVVGAPYGKPFEIEVG